GLGGTWHEGSCGRCGRWSTGEPGRVFPRRQPRVSRTPSTTAPASQAAYRRQVGRPAVTAAPRPAATRPGTAPTAPIAMFHVSTPSARLVPTAASSRCTPSGISRSASEPATSTSSVERTAATAASPRSWPTALPPPTPSRPENAATSSRAPNQQRAQVRSVRRQSKPSATAGRGRTPASATALEPGPGPADGEHAERQDADATPPGAAAACEHRDARRECGPDAVDERPAEGAGGHEGPAAQRARGHQRAHPGGRRGALSTPGPDG